MNPITDREAKIAELKKSGTNIGNLDVKILPPGRGEKAPKIQLVTRDGGTVNMPTTVVYMVPFLSHAGPTGNFHSDEHGIHGDDRPKFGCFDFVNAKWILYIEQDGDGSLKRFYEKTRAALRAFFLDPANVKCTQHYFKALAAKQQDEAYTAEMGEQWVRGWEDMNANTFPGLQIPVKPDYRDDEKVVFSKKATTRMVYPPRSEDEALASWPKTLLHGVNSSEFIDPTRYIYAAPKPMTMYGEAVPLMVLKELKDTKGVSVPVHLCMNSLGLFCRDGEFLLTWYLGKSITFLASLDELKDPQQLKAANSAAAPSAEPAFPYLPKPEAAAGAKRAAEEPASAEAKRPAPAAPEAPEAPEALTDEQTSEGE